MLYKWSEKKHLHFGKQWGGTSLFPPVSKGNDEADAQLTVAAMDVLLKNWMLCWRRSLIHSYESCSVTHEAKNIQLLGLRKTILRMLWSPIEAEIAQ